MFHMWGSSLYSAVLGVVPVPGLVADHGTASLLPDTIAEENTDELELWNRNRSWVSFLQILCPVIYNNEELHLIQTGNWGIMVSWKYSLDVRNKKCIQNLRGNHLEEIFYLHTLWEISRAHAQGSSPGTAKFQGFLPKCTLHPPDWSPNFTVHHTTPVLEHVAFLEYSISDSQLGQHGPRVPCLGSFTPNKPCLHLCSSGRANCLQYWSQFEFWIIIYVDLICNNSVFHQWLTE
jgi:hypothetical protein